MNAKTCYDWQAECNYISNTTDAVLRGSYLEKCRALRNFNNDRACFVRYCQMQMDTAEHDSRHDSAEYIQHCINDLTA